LKIAVVANFSLCGSLVKWADDCKPINGPCGSLEETTENSPVLRLRDWEERAIVPHAPSPGLQARAFEKIL